MALQIMKKNGVFIVEGSLNSETSKSFKNHINLLLQYCNKVEINIDNVKEIDASGLSVLRQFINDSQKGNRTFCITGYGNNKFYSDFRSEYAA